MGKTFKASKWIEKNWTSRLKPMRKSQKTSTHGLFGKTGAKKYYKQSKRSPAGDYVG
jgi:hypothetical protein